MDIFIKSFNRPYHLDRCLFSINKFVQGYSRIVILDDGTPEKYLAKIKTKYPDIVIKKSEFYREKSKAIENNSIDRAKLKFPGKFWHREISQGSDYFLLLEDDFFIVHAINLLEIIKFMEEQKVFQYKLLWQGRKEFTKAQTKRFGENEIIVTKNRFYSSGNFRRLLYNKYKLKGIFSKFGKKGSYFKYFMLPFYKYYTVAGVVFNKDLFSELWKDIENLNEFTQIFRMLKFYENRALPLKVAKSSIESIETTYLTSATNEFQDINFSVFEFNRIINDAWYNDEFEASYGYPLDHGRQYFKNYLPIEMHQAFDEWIERFSYNYIDLGCKVIT